MTRDPAEAIAQLQAATAQLDARTRAMAAAREQREAARRDEAVKTAEARRRGEHGRDWQILQQRIDLGQTSEFAVLQGLDLSTEARAVRTAMGKTLGELEDAAEEEHEGPVPLTPEMVEAQQRLVETLQRLRESTRASGLQ
ncbi:MULTISPECIES: hypothetical protein [Leucobacter]|uniref:Uncharacterized protein n=2 Tax=Leucobacter TaxID=55968 RepID=A0ABP5N0F4_9MICO|nr:MULTISPECIES: hypothetical protein [Leucobacter]MBS3183149.1 hypothetical protein [Leucobacter manosquensis]